MTIYEEIEQIEKCVYYLDESGVYKHPLKLVVKIPTDEGISEVLPLNQAIKSLLDREITAARIDEVNRISRYVELRNTADGATISAHYLYRQARKRIDQLQGSTSKETDKDVK